MFRRVEGSFRVQGLWFTERYLGAFGIADILGTVGKRQQVDRQHRAVRVCGSACVCARTSSRSACVCARTSSRGLPACSKNDFELAERATFSL